MSILWDDVFDSDDAALAAFEQAVAEDSMAALVDVSNELEFQL